MAMSTIFALLLCSYGVLAGKQTYPVSGSWFHDRVNVTDLNHTLSAFKLIGGDTILLQGAELRIRQPDDIRSDPEFADCMIGKSHSMVILMTIIYHVLGFVSPSL